MVRCCQSQESAIYLCSNHLKSLHLCQPQHTLICTISCRPTSQVTLLHPPASTPHGRQPSPSHNLINRIRCAFTYRPLAHHMCARRSVDRSGNHFHVHRRAHSPSHISHDDAAMIVPLNRGNQLVDMSPTSRPPHVLERAQNHNTGVFSNGTLPNKPSSIPLAARFLPFPHHPFAKSSGHNPPASLHTACHGHRSPQSMSNTTFTHE